MSSGWVIPRSRRACCTLAPPATVSREITRAVISGMVAALGGAAGSSSADSSTVRDGRTACRKSFAANERCSYVCSRWAFALLVRSLSLAVERPADGDPLVCVLARLPAAPATLRRAEGVVVRGQGAELRGAPGFASGLADHANGLVDARVSVGGSVAAGVIGWLKHARNVIQRGGFCEPPPGGREEWDQIDPRSLWRCAVVGAGQHCHQLRGELGSGGRAIRRSAHDKQQDTAHWIDSRRGMKGARQLSQPEARGRRPDA
eukprot:scaffold8226_cov114-Isochrysis_galbana.AAC.6